MNDREKGRVLNNDVVDLRSALDLLRDHEGMLVETDVEVDPKDEVSAVYRHIGSGGTVARPTRIGPAMLFANVKDHPDARIAIGLLASRKRVGLLLDEDPQDVARALLRAVEHPVDPIEVDNDPVCQEVVYRADDQEFDLRRIIPVCTNTPDDAGPYITLGMAYASSPVTGVHDVTIHRLCVQGPDELSIFMSPGARHIGHFYEEAEELGRPLPISISIGVDPAIEMATCFEPPTTPLGFDELTVAGALRGKPVDLARCLTIPELCIAHAEYVIEGEILPYQRCREDQNSNTGFAMPEFPGYTGPAVAELPLIKVKAVTTRKDPIYQCCIGPSEEHVSLAGIPTEASIIAMIDRAMPGKVKQVYCASPGGGKFMAVIQFAKTQPSDEGRQRQAALLAFSAFNELKNVFLVDEDVDPFDIEDVVWALNTRCQSDVDVVSIPGVRHHPLDLSADPAFSPSIRDHGISTKTIYDCTVPFDLKHRFVRARFADVDPKHWVSGFEAN